MEKYSLTEEQKRLWFEWKLNPSSHAYNTSMQFKINGKIDLNKFRGAILESIKYFDTFRTYFVEVESVPFQILSEDDINLKYIDLCNLEICTQKDVYATELLTEQLRQAFDLTRFPLVKFILIKSAESTYYFGFFTPHILLDAGSASKFLKFISSFYNGQKEEINLFWENKNSLSDYHTNTSTMVDINAINSFWFKHLAGHNLNYNFNNGQLATDNISGERVHFSIKKPEYEALKKLAYNNKTTIFSVLLGLFDVLLWLYYKNEDVVTSYPVSTRPR
jgi:hypothetical protein